MQVGIVGKPNAGKSTFFSAATLTLVPIANYPFTTIRPNHGVSYVRSKCVCKERDFVDQPRNSKCVDGERFIPVDLIDCPGLVPGASEGRGLGNQFLDELRRADALIHVVDASGSTDSEGKLTAAGGHDPLEDVAFLYRELDAWMYQILAKEWEKIARKAESAGEDVAQSISDRLSGLGIKRAQVENSLKNASLVRKPTQWSPGDLLRLMSFLRKSAKPVLLAANKIDLPSSRSNLTRLRDTGDLCVPVSAEAELALRRAAERRLISYKPGDSTFSPDPQAHLTEQQRTALEMIREHVLGPIGGTGVQEAIDSSFFRLLDMIVVYPVEDPERWTDHSGNILPDALLVPRGSTLKDLALRIHTELGERLLYGINARSGMRLSDSYVLKDRDVVSIVSAAERR